jgi:hypothetical protein
MVREAMTRDSHSLAASERAEPLANPARASDMRSVMRTVSAFIVFMVLLAGSAVGVTAQSDEPAPVAFVTGTVMEQYHHFEGEERDEWEPAHVRGFDITSGRVGVIEQLIDWSDPRLPERQWMNLSYTLIAEPPDLTGGAMVVTTSHLLVGPDGSWHGTGRAVEDEDDRYSLYELIGEEAYEGLFAVLRTTPGEDTHGPWEHSYEGYIFEADPLPVPAPPEPATSEGMQVFPYPTEPPTE